MSSLPDTFLLYRYVRIVYVEHKRVKHAGQSSSQFEFSRESKNPPCFVIVCCERSENFRKKQVQSTLGFETLDKAAALGLETATPLTDPRQYINSNLGFRNLKI